MPPTPMKLLIATRNAHKLEEIQAIFSSTGLDFVTMASFPDIPEVEEDGDTFEANARKKAVTLATATKLWTLADDSGLEVDALGGAPGVFSARYAGEPVSYAANNAKLLKEMRNARTRAARFRCTIALSDPGGVSRIVEGKCEGRIIDEERGVKGFGYDPLFIPDGYEVTFAEMDAATKNRISHRAAALQRAAESWKQVLEGDAVALSQWK